MPLPISLIVTLHLLFIVKSLVSGWFLFHSIMWGVTFIDLHFWNILPLQGINPSSRSMILFMWSWIWFACILLGIIHLYSSRGYWPIVFCSGSILFWLPTRVIPVSWNEFGGVYPFLISERTAVSFFYNRCSNSPVNAPVPGLFFPERISITNSIYLHWLSSCIDAVFL